MLGAAVMAMVAATVSAAQADEVLLTLTGNVAGGEKTFTDAELLALAQVSFETSTIWTEGKATYSGPTLAAVLEAAGAGDGDLVLTAINDYSVEMDRALVQQTAPIVANRIDGEAFNVREKGPLWVVFPYDSGPEYQSEVAYAMSVWQLLTIEVK